MEDYIMDWSGASAGLSFLSSDNGYYEKVDLSKKFITKKLDSAKNINFPSEVDLNIMSEKQAKFKLSNCEVF